MVVNLDNATLYSEIINERSEQELCIAALYMRIQLISKRLCLIVKLQINCQIF